MTNDCARWKDELLEAALTGTVAQRLQEHLSGCGDCALELATLRARRERLDKLLPMMVREAEPSSGFRARVLAAAESAKERRVRTWRVWALTGATAAVAVALMIGFLVHRRTIPAVPGGDLASAEKLAEWRAPSDVFLITPGQEILRTTPKLGESYLKMSTKKHEEE